MSSDALVHLQISTEYLRKSCRTVGIDINCLTCLERVHHTDTLVWLHLDQVIIKSLWYIICHFICIIVCKLHV